MNLLVRDQLNREEGFSEGLAEGLAEGFTKGRSERDKEMIEKKLRKGWSPERIHEDDEYPMELILEIQKELLYKV